jgi:hypothetical protein
MANLDGSKRLPRGTKPVANAFISAVEELPVYRQEKVMKAAIEMIRDHMKASKKKLAA